MNNFFTSILVRYKKNGHYYGILKSEKQGCDGCVFKVKCAYDQDGMKTYKDIFHCGDGKVWADLGMEFPHDRVSDFCTFFEIK